MVRHFLRRARLVVLTSLVLSTCGGGRTPVQPTAVLSSPSAARTRLSVGLGDASSGSTVVAWSCFVSASLGQPAACVTSPAPGRVRPDSAPAVTAPEGPTGLAASVSSARVTLTWTAPSAGDAPSSYVVEAGSAAGRSDVASFDTGTTAVSLVVDNVPAATYFIRVRAKNTAGLSAPSNEVTATVRSDPACTSRPNAPTGFSAAASGTSVTLTWTAASDGCAPTGYAVEGGSAPGLTNLANVNTGSTATSFSTSGVAAGTYYLRVRAVNAAGQSSPSNEAVLTVGSTSLGSCAAWATLQRGTGVPPPSIASVATQRQNLYNAGGGLKVVGSKYYAAYFPSGFATSATRHVMIALHGTGGSPEAEWTDWQAQMQARNWGFLGLKYLNDATGAYDDENTIYSNIKSLVTDVQSSCDLGNTSFFLVGFSRGSAQAIPVGYLDLVDRRLLTAVGNNSGAWAPGGLPPPTLQTMAARGDRTAMSGTRYWMYCGEQDFEQGWPMCDGMQGARDWLTGYGATVAALYRDPTGTHGGLTRNSTAMSQMFTYFEGLR